MSKLVVRNIYYKEMSTVNVLDLNRTLEDRIPKSSTYTIDSTVYPADREERMIRHLDDFFWKSFFYLRMNKIDGDYLEFGCGSNIRSFRLAAKYKALEYPVPRLFAFDSFLGLPEPKGIDVHPHWKKGSMAVSLEEFRAVMKHQGLADKDYHPFEGFFDQTLRNHSPAEYGIHRAAMVFIDCDLYESTLDVLNFVRDILIPGGILAFDDWYCFSGAPDRGEQRAFHEFRTVLKDVTFIDYMTFGWHGRSFITHIQQTSQGGHI